MGRDDAEKDFDVLFEKFFHGGQRRRCRTLYNVTVGPEINGNWSRYDIIISSFHLKFNYSENIYTQGVSSLGHEASKVWASF